MKIGHAENVENRLSQIQTGNPYKCEIIRKIQCKDKQEAMSLEDYLHTKYHEYQTEAENEWFNICVLDILRNKTDNQLKKEAETLPNNIVRNYLKSNKKQSKNVVCRN